ncbi:L-lactate dehydrogenase [Fusobacterium sp. FSA-380-WT-3A]|uniref:L-lactate dehydrogenase n=1 Tax=Fusobacterium sp. FSA-380-WT-3A TaxID=2725304 RepID=UPI001476FD0E|nr:L-lactate dehydrogenase [Fusobacterium sp. FSA-380-WT-3A]NME35771.1 L-lactate dehydrogenase [Fusobacterium sp. FSA-380-WT-3A]
MEIKSRKVVVIGAGHVGSHVGFSLVTQGACDELVYIDIDKNKAIAQAEDTHDAVVYLPHRVRVKAGDYSDIDDAEIIVISAGPLPLPGETRMDELFRTIELLQSIVEGIKNSKFSGIIINISNPADVVTQYFQRKLNYSVNKILSTSTTLDSARLRKILSRKLNIDSKSIYAYVMGEHGESQMVPWSVATIFGKSLLELMKEEPETYGKLNLEEIAKEARYGGWLVLDGKGGTEFGIGTSCVELIKTIFADEKKVSMVSTLLNGEYGEYNVYASVPAILGKNGVEKIIELPMSKEDLEKFKSSCKYMRDNFLKVKDL